MSPRRMEDPPRRVVPPRNHHHRVFTRLEIHHPHHTHTRTHTLPFHHSSTIILTHKLSFHSPSLPPPPSPPRTHTLRRITQHTLRRITQPTWKPSSKPIEKSKDKDIKELIKVDFSYGSFHSDDFTEPLPQTDILVVKQLVNGVGKRAGNWKENFEAAFIPATAKV